MPTRLDRFDEDSRSVRKDGSRFPADAILMPLREARGRRAAEARSLELTEELRRAEEAEVARWQQMQIRDEFLSHVSHELRSPLASISSFASILGDGLAGATNPKQDEYLAIILKNTRQLQAMIEDLLEVTHAETGESALEAQQTKSTEAIAYAVETMKDAAEAKRIQLSAELDPSLALVYADPLRLRQILTILLDNAIKFTPAGGSVRVRAAPDEDAEMMQRIEVEDTGCGLSPEFTEKIFERLYQVPRPHGQSRRGLGLGLYIARRLARQMGGWIWATSEPGNGSQFYVTIPLFSLEKQLAPVLTLEAAPACALLLFTVSVTAGGQGAQSGEEAANACRLLLKSCLRSETDILLPNLCPQKRSDLLFLVSFSRLDSTDVLSGRMRATLGRSEELRRMDARTSISYRVLGSTETFASAPGARKAQLCAEIRQTIAAACKEKTP